MSSAESQRAVTGEDGEDQESWLDGVQSVVDGLAFGTVGKFVLMGIGFLLNLVLTRGLGVSLYGMFAFGQKLVQTVLLFTNFGSDVSVMKFVSANTDDPATQRRIVGLSYLTTLVVGGLVGAGIFLAAPRINAWTLDAPAFETALRAFAIAIPFQGLTNIAINSFRGLEHAGGQTAMRILTPLSQFLAVAAALALGYSLLGVAVAFTVGTAVAFTLSLGALVHRTHLRPALGLSWSEVKSFFHFSVPFTFSRAGAVLYRRTDVFMVGLLLSASAVGIYNVALLVGGLIAMPLAGLNQLFPSVASRLYAEDDFEALDTVYTTVTRWSVTAALPIAAPLVVYRREVLGVFGPDLVAGATVLVVFAAGQLANAAAGPSNDVLTMTDHQYLVMVNHWVFGVANVVLNYLLITRVGVVGAAIATATVLALVNVVRVVEVWYLTGLVAYSPRLWKPLAAAGVATAAMLAVGSVLSGLLLAIAGGLFGVGVYLGTLLVLGIDDRDRRVASQYVSLGE